MFYFITVVVSLFIGFLVMFSANADFGVMLKVMNVFMVSVLSIVVIGIIRKQVFLFLVKRRSLLTDSIFSIWVITLILSALALAGGYVLGTQFLGGDMSVSFMLRWCAALGSIFLLLGPYYLIKRVEDAHIAAYKSILFTYALPKIQQDARYNSSGIIGRQSFTDSKLYQAAALAGGASHSAEIVAYKGSDLILRPDAQFQFCHLEVMQRETQQSAGKTEVKISQLFNGYFIVMDFNKPFTGETFIVPDDARALFGEVTGESLNRLGKRPGTQLAFMEDPEFEESFTVYTSDEQEARYILSPKLIERIRLFNEHFFQPVSISFVGHHVYIGIQHDNDLFSPPLFGPIYNERAIEEQLDMLEAILTLPEQFDIKRDIWKH